MAVRESLGTPALSVSHQRVSLKDFPHWHIFEIVKMDDWNKKPQQQQQQQKQQQMQQRQKRNNRWNESLKWSLGLALIKDLTNDGGIRNQSYKRLFFMKMTNFNRSLVGSLTELKALEIVLFKIEFKQQQNNFHLLGENFVL